MRPTPPRAWKLGRRRLLASGPALAVALRLAPAAAADDPRMSLRAAGDPNASQRVSEWFSLTCVHCARFSQDVYPEIKAKLIDTGKLYYEFHDFPLDRVALMAAMVARALPVNQYVPFVDALLASQDRWAFAPGVDTKAQLQQMAALAGMAPATFESAIADTALQKEILAEQDAAQKKYNINSTPSFVFHGTTVPGEMTYDTFVGHLAKA